MKLPHATNFSSALSEDLVVLSDYMFHSPNIYLGIVLIFIISIFSAVLFDMKKFFELLIILFGTNILSTVFTTIYGRFFEFPFYLRRTIFLSLISAITVFIIALSYRLSNYIIKIDFVTTLLFSFAITIWFNHLVFICTATSSHLSAIPATLNYSIFGTLLIALFYPLDIKHIFIYIIYILIFLNSAYILLHISGKIWRRNFNVDGMFLIRNMLSHLTNNDEKSRANLENFFDSHSVALDTKTAVLLFSESGHEQSNVKKAKIMVLIPMIHPGPFAQLGSSDFPVQAREYFKNYAEHVIVLHTTTTHSSNIPTKKETLRFLDEIRNGLSTVVYPAKISKLISSKSKFTEVKTLTLDNTILHIVSGAQVSLDDIDERTGMECVTVCKKYNIHDGITIDAHNSLTPGIGNVVYGTEISNEIIRLCSENCEKAINNRVVNKVHVGYAEKTDYNAKKDGIGGSGIQVLIMDIEKTKYAWLVFDGNNMVPTLTEKLKTSLKNLVDDVTVLTTDTHVVNATIGGYNPVGMKTDHEKIIGSVKRLVETALKNMVECTIGVAVQNIKNVRIFGPFLPERLSRVTRTSYNRVLRLMAISIIVNVLLSFIVSLLI